MARLKIANKAGKAVMSTKHVSAIGTKAAHLTDARVKTNIGKTKEFVESYKRANGIKELAPNYYNVIKNKLSHPNPSISSESIAPYFHGKNKAYIEYVTDVLNDTNSIDNIATRRRILNALDYSATSNPRDVVKHMRNNRSTIRAHSQNIKFNKKNTSNNLDQSDASVSTLSSFAKKYAPAAFGFATTAWLVNKLSDNRGQQTNAQLYGQQQYY